VVTGDANSPSSYHCQAQITLASYQSGQATASSLTLNYTPSTGSNRLIFVAIAAESRQYPGTDAARPTSVKYGGTQMLPAAKPYVEQAGTDDYWGPDHFVFYVPESVIASKSGQQALVIDSSANTHPNQMIIANLVQLNGVNQTSPLGPFAGGALGTHTTPEAPDPSVISPTLAITTSGSRIYSFTSALWSDSKTCSLNVPTSGCPAWSVSPSSGLTLTETMSSTQLNIGDAVMRGFGMYVSAASASLPTAGNYVPSWSIPYSGRMTHLAVVISPAVQP
jgi:hypothetical protein